MRSYMKIAALCIIFSVLLTGCKTKYGSIPSEQEVLDEMSKVVEQENYELVEKEEKNTKPKACVYYFKSTDRDLEFIATSTLKRNSLLGSPTPDFVDKISNNYADAVKGLYTDEIVDIFKESSLFDEDNIAFKIKDEKQYNEVLELLYLADQVYAREIEYNTPDWMEDNPAMLVELDYEIDGVYYFGSKVRIVGTMSKDDVASKMEHCREWAEKFKTKAED